MYYASIGLLALILHCIINLEYLKPSEARRIPASMERYRTFLLSIAVFYVADTLWGVFEASKIVPLTYLDSLVFFITMVVTVILWTRFVIAYLGQKGMFSLILTIAGWIIAIFEVIVLLINIIKPIAFWFDEEGNYHTGMARLITLFLQLALYLGTSGYSISVAIKSKENSNSEIHHRSIGISGFVMAVFIALQDFFPMLPFYSMGCLIATSFIHTFVIQGEKSEQKRALGSAKQIAYRDPLTGVKSARAYSEAKELLNQRISSLQLKELGVVVCDVNNLKWVNDNLGHEAGDQYIKDAGAIICNQFQHSPVFRIGGDEFVVLLEGDDYKQRLDLIEDFNVKMEENNKNDLVVISAGLDVFRAGRDICYDSVFERADQRMYERKKALKAMHPKSA